MMSNSKPTIALLTNCTATTSFEPLVRIEEMPIVSTMNELLIHWTDAIEVASKKHPDKMRTPGELYGGLSFDTVTEIAQIIGHKNIFVVNRGAGLVRHDEKLVPYNFSYDKKVPESAHFKVTGEKFMPQLWWPKINAALHGEEFPITKATDVYDYVLVSLPPGFVRLVSKDLAQVRDLKHRLFIPTPRSHASLAPVGIRDATVPYMPVYTSDIEYSRYDKCHRVAQKFLREGLESGDFEQYANSIRGKQFASVIRKTGSNKVSYEELFEEHPSLLEHESVAAAMGAAKMQGLNIGSKTQFVGAWRGAQGTIQVSSTKAALNNARGTLRAVMASMHETDTTDEELLSQIGLFVAAVTEEDPQMIFTPRQVAAWGRLTYPAESEQTAKRGIRSGGKVSGALRSHTAYLGLEQIMVGSSPAYRLTQE